MGMVYIFIGVMTAGCWSDLERCSMLKTGMKPNVRLGQQYKKKLRSKHNIANKVETHHIIDIQFCRFGEIKC